jgi:hypothetical protein
MRLAFDQNENKKFQYNLAYIYEALLQPTIMLKTATSEGKFFLCQPGQQDTFLQNHKLPCSQDTFPYS